MDIDSSSNALYESILCTSTRLAFIYGCVFGNLLRQVALPSGLLYKVIRKGAGKEHPLVGTTCQCHYEGKLIDGTKFDSSYDRGSPTSFAPNQVNLILC